MMKENEIEKEKKEKKEKKNKEKQRKTKKNKENRTCTRRLLLYMILLTFNFFFCNE